MKNKLAIFALLAICLCVGAQAWAGNLLLNPGFEDNDTGMPDHFQKWPPDYITDIQVDPSVAHTGNNFLEIQSSTSGWGVIYQLEGEEAPVTEGLDYTMSAYMRIPPGGTTATAILKIEWFDAPGYCCGTPPQAAYEEPFTVDSEEWTLYQWTQKVPTGLNLTHARFVYFSSDGNPVYIDDIAYCEGTVPCSAIGIDPLAATGGNPSGGVFANPNTTTELTWVNPATTPDLTEVFLIEATTEEGLDPNDLDNPAAFLDGCADACESVAVTLTPDKYYAWRVVTTFGSDPNQSEDWYFNTINTAPTAVAAVADKNHWLASGSVNVTLDGSGSVDADGYPGNPLTYAWTQTTGTSVGAIDAVESPVVSITAAGTYTFQLVVGDGLDNSVASDVIFEVYAESNDGLVGHWSFEDNLLADVGSPDGNAAGTNPIAYSNGPIGKALELNGTNWVDLPGTEGTSFLGITDEITISAWVRKNGAGFADWRGIVTKGDSAWRIATAAGNTAQAAFGTWTNGAEFAEANGTQNIEDGDWHHIVGTHDGVKAKIYIDGALDNEVDVQVPLQLGDTFAVRFGSNSESNTHLNGQIDEVRIFNKGLSAKRVLDMYAADGGGQACGGKYAVSDLNEDCKTDHEDLQLFIAEWLDCTDLTGVNCGN